MEAVACVIMNRVRRAKDNWGKTVAEVCKKDRQFSCWNVGDPNRDKMLAIGDSDTAFRQAIDAAIRPVAASFSVSKSTCSSRRRSSSRKRIPPDNACYRRNPELSRSDSCLF